MKYFYVFLFFFGFILGVFLFTPVPSYVLGSFSSVKYYDKDGEVFYEEFLEGSGYHVFVSLSELPQVLQDAVIGVEDKRFYSHFGIDPFALVRAIIQNIQAGRVISGASTITQQLARNVLSPKKRDFFHKLQEALIALKVDALYSKDEILEAYLNTIFYGENAYGIGAASRVFFNKTPQELTTEEILFLVGLPQSPSVYNPFYRRDFAEKRKNQVVNTLKKNGFFDVYCSDFSCLEKPVSLQRGDVSRIAPHYREEVQEELQTLLPEYKENRKNIEIYTYLDTSLYKTIHDLAQHHVEDNTDKNITNAAVVVLDHEQKGVIALLGSVDYFSQTIHGAVNNATSQRQPGSTIKPFTYALAFEMGKSPDSLILDSFLHLKTQEGLPYEPKNYDFEEYGEVSYRQALANSYNISAIKIAQEVGAENLLTTLRKLGMHTLSAHAETYGLALTLGDGEVRLLDLTEAYSVFPQGGVKYNYPFIREIYADGKLIYTRNNKEKENIFSAQTAVWITDILSDNTARFQQFGENSALHTSQWSGAKTGTTRNFRDNWTLGFDYNYTLGVWVGNANASYMQNSSGVTGAAPLWHDVMETLFQKERVFFQQEERNVSSDILQKIDVQDLEDNNLVILPQDGDIYFLEESNQEALILKSKLSADWYLDKEFFGKGKKLFWENPQRGKHCVEAQFYEKGKKELKCFQVF